MANNNVVETSDVFAAFLGNLNRQSKGTFVGQALDLANTSMNLLDTNLRNELTAIQQAIAQQIGVVETDVATALQKASILQNFELGQMEQAFADFLGTPGMTQILQDATITLDGSGYRLGSVIETIANSDKLASVSFQRDATGEELTGVTYTLDDGTIIPMAATKAADATTGDVTISVATENWKGMPASFELTYKAITKPQNVFGSNVDSTFYQPTGRSNLLFDLSGSLVAAVEVAAAAVTPDLNADGTVGNPAV